MRCESFQKSEQNRFCFGMMTNFDRTLLTLAIVGGA